MNTVRWSRISSCTYVIGFIILFHIYVYVCICILILIYNNSNSIFFYTICVSVFLFCHLWSPQKSHGVLWVGSPTSPSAQQLCAVVKEKGFSSELHYIIGMMEASIQPARSRYWPPAASFSYHADGKRTCWQW